MNRNELDALVDRYIARVNRHCALGRDRFPYAQLYDLCCGAYEGEVFALTVRRRGAARPRRYLLRCRSGHFEVVARGSMAPAALEWSARDVELRTAIERPRGYIAHPALLPTGPALSPRARA